MLDVRRLRILRSLATHGTVTAAAEALHLTAPAVSQQLAVLEREAGVPVVERAGRGLRLTAAGELLVAHAEVVLGDLAAAESDLAALRGGASGVVRVAAFASAARTLLPLVWRTVPLTVRLTEQEPEESLEALRRRECDLAVVHGYTVLPRSFPAGCEQSRLLEDPVMLALDPQRARREGLAEGEPVELGRFADAPWLAPHARTSCHEMMQRACGAAGFVPGVRAHSNDFAVLCALVAAGAGVALVPTLALPRDTAQLSLHPLRRPVVRTVFTAARAGTARRPDLRLLTEALREAAEAVRAPGVPR
jgi:DNA-binding transcriptional LysR family regulator